MSPPREPGQRSIFLGLRPFPTRPQRIACSRWAHGISTGKRKTGSSTVCLPRTFRLRGEDLADTGTLAAIGAEHGLDPDAIRIALAQRGALPNAPAVPGVPYFMFDGQTALSGAQPSDVLLAAMQRVIRHRESPDAKHQRIDVR